MYLAERMCEGNRELREDSSCIEEREREEIEGKADGK